MLVILYWYTPCTPTLVSVIVVIGGVVRKMKRRKSVLAKPMTETRLINDSTILSNFTRKPMGRSLVGSVPDIIELLPDRGLGRMYCYLHVGFPAFLFL